MEMRSGQDDSGQNDVEETGQVRGQESVVLADRKSGHKSDDRADQIKSTRPSQSKSDAPISRDRSSPQAKCEPKHGKHDQHLTPQKRQIWEGVGVPSLKRWKDRHRRKILSELRKYTKQKQSQERQNNGSVDAESRGGKCQGNRLSKTMPKAQYIQGFPPQA